MSLCPYCEGRGCDECDQTGRRYRQGFEIDGVSITVAGSGDGLSPELLEALAALAKAAFDRTAPPQQEQSQPQGENR